MVSVDELGGIVTLVGNQVRVSQMRSDLVSQIQMLKHRYESNADQHTNRRVNGGTTSHGLGLTREPRIKFRVIFAWGRRRSHR
jgi:hypothetical protein